MVAIEIAGTVWPYVEDGRLKPAIDSALPLDCVAEAHARMEAGEHVGNRAAGALVLALRAPRD